jgi:DNA polymerase V
VKSVCQRRGGAGGLFDNRDKSGRLMSVMDQINDRFGDGSLRVASSGLGREWKAKFLRRTPCYTIRWADLAKVRS